MPLFTVTGKLMFYNLGPYGRQVVPDSLSAIRWRGLATDEHGALRLSLWQGVQCAPDNVRWEVGPEIEQMSEAEHMRYIGAPELSLEV